MQGEYVIGFSDLHSVSPPPPRVTESEYPNVLNIVYIEKQDMHKKYGDEFYLKVGLKSSNLVLI
jgi:hypothetical protein